MPRAIACMRTKCPIPLKCWAWQRTRTARMLPRDVKASQTPGPGINLRRHACIRLAAKASRLALATDALTDGSSLAATNGTTCAPYYWTAGSIAGESGRPRDGVLLSPAYSPRPREAINSLRGNSRYARARSPGHATQGTSSAVATALTRRVRPSPAGVGRPPRRGSAGSPAATAPRQCPGRPPRRCPHGPWPRPRSCRCLPEPARLPRCARPRPPTSLRPLADT